jgi:hypothetical protein
MPFDGVTVPIPEHVMKKLALVLFAALAACDISNTTAPTDPTAPANLTFQLQPSGDPNVPLGIILSWDPPTNGRAVAFDVYGRSNSTGWIRRATTTSTTFHDVGTPQQQYYIVALDEAGNPMGESGTVTVDLSARLPAPLGLSSITLNGAIQLAWQPNAVHATTATFDHYRIYSSAYNSVKGACEDPWYFEGSTVSDAFLVGNLTNGVTRCYAVSAISVDGHESTWSAARMDTPRSDAKTVAVYAAEARSDSSSFLFLEPVSKKLGVVGVSTRTDADFIVNRHADGTLWITPGRVGVSLRLYQTTPVADLTTVDRAPISGYATTALQLSPGLAYVFQMQETDGAHYGVIRVQFVTADVVLFDWAFQDAAGNAELSRGVRRP